MIRVDYSSADGDDDRFHLVLDDRDWSIARPNLGETLSIELGYKEVGLAFMGDFTIERAVFSGVPNTITLTGTGSGAHKAMRAPITKDYHGKTLGEIIGDFAKQAGVSAAVHPDLADKKFDSKNITTSPGQAVQELGRIFGFVGKIANGKLMVTPRGGGESASGQAMPTLVLGPAHFGQWAVDHNERASYGSVRSAYFDNDRNERAHVEEKSPNANDSAFPPFVTSRLFGSKAEAEAAAKAQMQAITRSRGNADFTLAKGDPWVKDQQKVLIRGMRDGVDGSYVSELVSHSYTAETGIATTIKARPPEDGSNFESLFEQATGSERRTDFIVPDLGALMGEVLRDQSLPSAFTRFER